MSVHTEEGIGELRSLLSPEEWKEAEPLSRHTTFRVGGPARLFLQPASEDRLVQALRICRREHIPHAVIGHGSNLLAGDEGFPGVIVCTEGLTELTVENGTIRAGAGVMLARIAAAALEQGLTGFEFAAGIPGTLGGAVRMNAGAYGGELKDVLLSAKVLTAEGELLTRPVAELAMGYRDSVIAHNGDIVLGAALKLTPGDPAAIRERMEDLAVRRREKQPLEYPSAGSTFKRPQGYFAGKLIQDAGLRGFTVGGAQVSEKHCGFVINRDHASAADISCLCKRVQEEVKRQFGVDLELEVRRLQEETWNW